MMPICTVDHDWWLPLMSFPLGCAEVLAVFREEVVQIQTAAAAADEAPPLSGLHHQLAPWKALLPPLHCLLSDAVSPTAATAASPTKGSSPLINIECPMLRLESEP